MKALVLPLAYLLGSLPFAYLVVRWRAGGDLRQLGSGTVGATNAARVLGKGWGLLVMVLDVGKGVAAVWLSRLATGNPAWHVAAACAAVVGHCFPLWLSFRGGKGLATSAGALLVLSPWTLAASALVWLGALAATRVLAVASALAAASLPVIFWAARQPSLLAQACVVCWSLVLLVSHRRNLQRWVRGEEPRVGRR